MYNATLDSFICVLHYTVNSIFLTEFCDFIHFLHFPTCVNYSALKLFCRPPGYGSLAPLWEPLIYIISTYLYTVGSKSGVTTNNDFNRTDNGIVRYSAALWKWSVYSGPNSQYSVAKILKSLSVKISNKATGIQAWNVGKWCYWPYSS